VGDMADGRVRGHAARHQPATSALLSRVSVNVDAIRERILVPRIGDQSTKSCLAVHRERARREARDRFEDLVGVFVHLKGLGASLWAPCVRIDAASS
jgi:hypothetical protein